MSLPDEIRASAAAGQFARAAEQFAQYTAGLCAAIRSGNCARHEIEECRRLLDECRIAMLAARGQLADRRRELAIREYVAGAYR